MKAHQPFQDSLDNIFLNWTAKYPIQSVGTSGMRIIGTNHDPTHTRALGSSGSLLIGILHKHRIQSKDNGTFDGKIL